LNALCLSCFCGHARLVEYFLQRNVHVNETDKPNGTDHYFSSLPVDNEHKMKMREMRCRVAQDMGMFHYPLHIAIKQDSLELVRLFVKYREQLNIEISEAYTKKTALHIAADKCSTEVRAVARRRRLVAFVPYGLVARSFVFSWKMDTASRIPSISTVTRRWTSSGNC
jgi:hypothetical protein